MQDTKNWNIHTLEPSIPKSTEKFLCFFFFKNLTKGPQKNQLRNWELKMHGIEFLQTDPHFIPILKQKKTIIIRIIVICCLSIGYYLQERGTDSASAAFTRERWGEKDFVSCQWQRVECYSRSLCVFLPQDVRSTGKEKLPNTSVQTESSSPGARYCKERHRTSPAKPLENVQIIPKIY